MSAIYEILIRGRADGTIAGSHAIYFDEQGRPLDAQPLTTEALAACVDAFEGNAIAQVAALEAELAARPTAEEIKEKDDTIKALQAEIELLRNPPAPPVDALLSELGAAFKASVPAELQGQFGDTFAAVRTLLLGGDNDLARKTVEARQVPEELEPVKETILAKLP